MVLTQQTGQARMSCDTIISKCKQSTKMGEIPWPKTAIDLGRRSQTRMK